MLVYMNKLSHDMYLMIHSIIEEVNEVMSNHSLLRTMICFVCIPLLSILTLLLIVFLIMTPISLLLGWI